MNVNNFLSFLQQLLTMVDPNDEASRTLAQNALHSVVALAKISGKADSVTIRMMITARENFGRLLFYREDFMGVPGEMQKNAQKRQRLANMLYPSC